MGRLQSCACAAVMATALGCAAMPLGDVTALPASGARGSIAASSASAHSTPSPARQACTASAHLFAGRARVANVGDVQLLQTAAGVRVWFPADYSGPFHSALINPDGTFGPERDEAPFGPKPSESYALAATGDAGVAAAGTVFVDRTNGDIYAARWRDGQWSAARAIVPSPEYDHAPVVAVAPDGRVGIAWRHGPFPRADDLAFAVWDSDADSIRGGVVAPGGDPEGVAVVPVPSGWLILYTPSSLRPDAERGLDVLELDADGKLVAHRRLVDGPFLWPVAAWNGTVVGVAVHRDDPATRGGPVVFLLLDAHGELLAPARVVHRDPDARLSVFATSLVPAAGAFWLGDVADFPMQGEFFGSRKGHVVRLDADGAATGSWQVGQEDHRVWRVELTRTEDGVRGVYVGDRWLHTFEVVCAGEATAPSP